jgi:hypothetical protein
MHFHVEQRRAWVRTRSHTLVFDRDPDFEYFCKDRSGEIKQLYRIWLADTPANKRAYLGSIRHCQTGWPYEDLIHLFRRASHSAKQVGIPPRTLRPRLAGFLRGLTWAAKQGRAAQGAGSQRPGSDPTSEPLNSEESSGA